MAKRPLKSRKKKSKRDSRGRFVAKTGKKKKTATKKPRLIAKRKRVILNRLNPEKIMRAIARRFEDDGIEVADSPSHVDDRILRGEEIWHYYWVEFVENFSLQDIPFLTTYFRAVLRRRYFRGTIIRVAVGIENSSGLTPSLWRTLVATDSTLTAFSQVANHAEAWLRGSDYAVVMGIGVDVRAPKYYEEGLL